MNLEEYKLELEECISRTECESLMEKAENDDDLTDLECDILYSLKEEKINNM